MTTPWKPLASIAALALTACAPSTIVGPVRTAHGVEMQEIDAGSLYALRRASGEIPCPEEQLAVQPIGAGGYRVDGCGALMTYDCIHTPRGGLCQLRERQTWVERAAPVTARDSTAHDSTTQGDTVQGDTPPTTSASADSSTASAAREAIRTRTASVLACVGSDAIALEVTWTAEGTLDASLRGSLHGTEEEACVRAAIADLTVPAPGTAGRVLHAVQR